MPIDNTEANMSKEGGIQNELARAVIFGQSGAIENQEAEGQRQLCESTQLPTEVTDTSKKALEDAGVVFGESSKDDDIFCSATLPEGWEVKPTDHSMWSALHDANGNVRANIFYKAAFYDRSAHMTACGRYRTDSDYQDEDETRTVSVTDMREKKTIHATEPVSRGEYEKYNNQYKEADAWLDKNFPDWKNAAAYWDKD